MAKIMFVFIMATIVVATTVGGTPNSEMSELRGASNRDHRPSEFLKRLRNWLLHMLARTEELIEAGVTEDSEPIAARRAYETLTNKIEAGVTNLISSFDQLGAYVGYPNQEGLY